MISIFKRLWSKKRRVFFWVIIILAGYGISLASCEISEWFNSRIFSTFQERFFHNVKEIDKDLMKFYCNYLEIEKIPESAEEIYIYPRGIRDKSIFCSMTLSSEEIPKFAEYFIGVPISVFKSKEGIDWRDIKDDIVRSEIFGINKGDASAGIVKNWNLTNIKNIKYFEVNGKTEEEFKKLRMEIYGNSEEDAKSYYGTYSNRFIAIDMDTNRVYLYVG